VGTRFGDVDRILNIALTRAMQEMGQAVFIKSQAYCPVQSGELRDSGKYTKIPGGFKIRYTKAYAARREFGIEAGRVIKVRRHRVGGFVGPMGRRVAGAMRGPYTYQTSGERGSHYLQRAVDEEAAGFGKRLARHLRMLTRK